MAVPFRSTSFVSELTLIISLVAIACVIVRVNIQKTNSISVTDVADVKLSVIIGFAFALPVFTISSASGAVTVYVIELNIADSQNGETTSNTTENGTKVLWKCSRLKICPRFVQYAVAL